jgi:hypothetical protein
MKERIPFETLRSALEPPRPIAMSEPTSVTSDQIPDGYALFKRDVLLLDGTYEPAFYSTHKDQVTNSTAWEQSSRSVMAAFIWALQVPEFADNETASDDRAQEIGNIMGYALTCGLTEEQVVKCYEDALTLTSSDN